MTRRTPITPIFDEEPQRGAILVGNTPGEVTPISLDGANHWWDFSVAWSLTISGTESGQVSDIADLIGTLDMGAPNDDPQISSLNGHLCVESFGDRGASNNSNSYMVTTGGPGSFPDISEPCTFAIAFARDYSGLGGADAFWGTGCAFDLKTSGGATDGVRIDINSGGTNGDVLFIDPYNATNTVLRTAQFEEVLAVVIVFNGASSTVHINGVLEHTFDSGGNGIKGCQIFAPVGLGTGHDLLIGEAQTSDQAQANPAAFSTLLEAKWSGAQDVADVFTLPDSTFGLGMWIDAANDILWAVGISPNRLVAVDISDPTNLTQISNTALSFVPSRLVKVGNYLYCTGDTSDSIWSIDVSTPGTPGTPYQNYSFPYFNDLNSIGTDGTYLYANGYRITINSPTSLSPADAVTTHGKIESHFYNAATSQLWWVTGANDSTVLVDVDGTHAGLGYLTDTINTPSAYGVVASGAYAFVGQDSGYNLTAIDFTTPGSPTIADSIVGADGRAVAINPATSRLYASGLTDGYFAEVDVSDPTNMTIVRRFWRGELSQARHAQYHNDYVFFVTATGYVVVVRG